MPAGCFNIEIILILLHRAQLVDTFISIRNPLEYIKHTKVSFHHISNSWAPFIFLPLRMKKDNMGLPLLRNLHDQHVRGGHLSKFIFVLSGGRVECEMCNVLHFSVFVLFGAFYITTRSGRFMFAHCGYDNRNAK